VAAVQLTVVRDAGEAEMLCGLLRAEGILCNHRETDVAAGDLASFGGWREVLVDESDLERARELLPEESGEPADAE
jgi:hypothetical protein